MAEKSVENVKHENIYAALSAFQGENPEIKKTVEVDFTTKTGQRVHYWYAPLDEFVQTIRPLLAKHGLSFVHEQAGKGEMQCVLYHDTSKLAYEEVVWGKGTEYGSTNIASKTIKHAEINIIRSMPIAVRRVGDMKDIGGDSTYARRYTLAEVTGCASDEDVDAPMEKIEKESAKNATKTLFTSFKEKINKGTKKDVEERIKIINSELELIEAKQVPKFGLTEEQYTELGHVATARLQALGVKEDIQTEDNAE